MSRGFSFILGGAQFSFGKISILHDMKKKMVESSVVKSPMY
jgi:hypothetical protein